jgi:nucleotidyltransferase/DNA polymerase involved in DNA repair
MGEGLSSYHYGIISAANALAKAAGVAVGMTAAEAAARLLQRP